MPRRQTSALLVIDMQNDFLAEGGYYDAREKLDRARQGPLQARDIAYLSGLYLTPPATYQIREQYQPFVQRVAELAATALRAGMATVFVQAVYDPASCDRPPLFLHDPQRLHYGCHPGSWGADFVEPIQDLTTHEQATVMAKPTFDAFFATALRKILRAKQIHTLYVTGVETNVCVLFTACSALSNGFETILVDDGVTTSQPALHEPALQILECAKAKRITAEAFMTQLRPGSVDNSP